MRRGTAKEEKTVCRGATSRTKLANVIVGGRYPLRSSAGKSLRIPAITKNIPVSKSTEIMCISMSPVPTGKLSQLSNCINGEHTAISTINTSTTLGNLWGIVLWFGRRSLSEKPHESALVLRRQCDYSTMVTVSNILQVSLRFDAST